MSFQIKTKDLVLFKAYYKQGQVESAYVLAPVLQVKMEAIGVYFPTDHSPTTLAWVPRSAIIGVLPHTETE